jgi:hypothetical protein
MKLDCQNVPWATLELQCAHSIFALLTNQAKRVIYNEIIQLIIYLNN